MGKSGKQEEVVIKVGGDVWRDFKKIVTDKKAAKRQPANVIYVESFEQLASILSAKRMQLIHYVARHRSRTVGEIAKEANRKQEAISKDIHLLEKYGLVSLRKEKTKVFVEPVGTKISILTA